MDIVVNYWAVLAGAVANMIVGTLWYGPVFGKYWQKLMGFTSESMKTMPLKAWQAMIGGFVTAFITSYVLAHVASVFSSSGIQDALMLGFWMWLGFTATTMATSFLWEGKPLALFILNATQGLVSMLAMALIVVLWV
jgi:hypothetical protein